MRLFPALVIACLALALASAVAPSADDSAAVLVLSALVPILAPVLLLAKFWGPALVLLLAGWLITRILPSAPRP